MTKTFFSDLFDTVAKVIVFLNRMDFSFPLLKIVKQSQINEKVPFFFSCLKHKRFGYFYNSDF